MNIQAVSWWTIRYHQYIRCYIW